MCGRYTLTAADAAQLRARFGIREAVAVEPRFNIAPGDAILAITTDRDGAPRNEALRWGLVPPFLKEPPRSGAMINARAESLADKPAFRGALERYRCLIPADGFYEWAPAPATGASRAKRAFHITRSDHALFAFAGLWSVWHRGSPEEIRSATIITTAANAAIRPIHDRMPVILAPEDEPAWLDHATPTPLLATLLRGPAADEIALSPVGPAVNDARHDAPDCLAAPVPVTDAPQTALF